MAPKSKTTFIFFLLGHNPAKAGLLTVSIVFNNILEITKSTPVLPADKLMSELIVICEFIEFHMLLSLELLIAVNGVSSSETIVDE